MTVDFKEYRDKHKTKDQVRLETLDEEFNRLQEISEQKQNQFNLKFNNVNRNATLEEIDDLMFAMGSAGVASQECLNQRKKMGISE